MTSLATNLTSKVKLNDGIEMPLFGLGVYMSSSGEGGEAERAVIHAVNSGYKLIDTAEIYGNEADVGRGIQISGIKREDLFVVTKLWTNGAEICKKMFNESFNRLDIGYIDLYLIHDPSNGKNIETYKTMLQLKAEGLVRSIGVSNFNVQHLEGLKAANLPNPSVNQIQLHPWKQNKEIVKYCRENGITVMGYSPLTRGHKLNDETLKNIAAKYGKSPAQVLIRWSVQQGFITILKSTKSSRITENTEVFDWSITNEDMAVLDGLPDESYTGTFNPCMSPWLG